MTDLGPYLGHATEQLLAGAFADRALIDKGTAARIVGVDEKTFDVLVEGGAILAVSITAKTKRYAEIDLRAFLARRTTLKVVEEPCPSTNQKRAVTTNTTSSPKVIGFTEARRQRLAARPSGSKRQKGKR